MSTSLKLFPKLGLADAANQVKKVRSEVLQKIVEAPRDPQNAVEVEELFYALLEMEWQVNRFGYGLQLEEHLFHILQMALERDGYHPAKHTHPRGPKHVEDIEIKSADKKRGVIVQVKSYLAGPAGITQLDTARKDFKNNEYEGCKYDYLVFASYCSMKTFKEWTSRKEWLILQSKLKKAKDVQAKDVQAEGDPDLKVYCDAIWELPGLQDYYPLTRLIQRIKQMLSSA